jgi:biopolymer transport protein ExbB
MKKPLLSGVFWPTVSAFAGLMLAQPAQAQNDDASMNFFEMFLWSSDPLGLLNIWVLVLMSAVSIALSIRFWMMFRRSALLPEETRSQIESLLADKKYRDAIDYALADPTYLGQVTSAALNEAGNGYQAMERAIEEAGDAATTRLIRPLEYLNVLGNIAPMLGLFGTVYGMIVAFQGLVSAGGAPDPAELAGGISTALVTTLWGLIVAMPALAAYALLRNQADALTTEGMLMAEELISPFKPSGKKSSRSSSKEKSDRPDKPERSDRPTPQPE